MRTMALGRVLRSRLATMAMTVVATGALVAGMTTAFATHDDPEEIHACVKNNGQIRIVGDPSDCNPSNETVLNWNGGGGGSGGLTGHEIVQAQAEVLIPEFSIFAGSATCPTGKKVLGGGYQPGSGDTAQAVHDFPETATSWKFAGFVNSFDDTPAALTVYAVCGDAT